MLIPRYRLGPCSNGMMLIPKDDRVPYRSSTYILCCYCFGDPFFGTHHTKVFTQSVTRVNYVTKT